MSVPGKIARLGLKTNGSIQEELMKVTRWLRVGVLATMVTGAPLVGPVHAQEVSDSHRAAARAAIAAVGATDRYDLILPQIGTNLKNTLIQNNPDLEQEIIDVVDEETLVLAQRRADLENEAAAIYARALTEADLRAIADFYATEAGQALIRNGPIATREVNQAAAIWQRGVERDLLENVTRRLTEAGLRQPPPAPEQAPEGETETQQ